MNIQFFGTKKCFDTKKTERYFKERKISYQFVDLTMLGLSKGELQSVKAVIGLNNLVNCASKGYKKVTIQVPKIVNTKRGCKAPQVEEGSSMSRMEGG